MTLGVANVPSIGMAPASLADNYQTIDICRGCSTAGLPLSFAETFVLRFGPAAF